jgi:hypothetical protein
MNEQWSYKWVMMMQERASLKLPEGEIREKSGKRRWSVWPICMPQSNMIRFPLMFTTTQLFPTSWPAPTCSSKLKTVREIQRRKDEWDNWNIPNTRVSIAIDAFYDVILALAVAVLLLVAVLWSYWPATI